MQNPIGKLITQTLAMPADTNPNGDLFGGWLVSQMDLAAGVLAKKVAKSRVVTVAIKSMAFVKPVKVGDIISCYAELIKIGTTSMNIDVEVWVQSYIDDKRYMVTKGEFIFVSINNQGQPQPVSTN